MSYTIQKKINERPFCKNCQDVSVKIGKGVSAFKLSYICKCGELVISEQNTGALKKQPEAVACKDGDSIICPACKSTLLSFREQDVHSLGFKVMCSCERVYDGYRTVNRVERNIGKFPVQSQALLIRKEFKNK